MKPGSGSGADAEFDTTAEPGPNSLAASRAGHSRTSADRSSAPLLLLVAAALDTADQRRSPGEDVPDVWVCPECAASKADFALDEGD
ncbi:rubredoxin [Novosphingobium kunmingense]|uniref:rubredoxin n=1 Tax=Novosphingobium kunmingense TaxID=1211806 RepID=UPI0018E25229